MKLKANGSTWIIKGYVLFSKLKYVCSYIVQREGCGPGRSELLSPLSFRSKSILSVECIFPSPLGTHRSHPIKLHERNLNHWKNLKKKLYDTTLSPKYIQGRVKKFHFKSRLKSNEKEKLFFLQNLAQLTHTSSMATRPVWFPFKVWKLPFGLNEHRNYIK